MLTAIARFMFGDYLEAMEAAYQTEIERLKCVNNTYKRCLARKSYRLEEIETILSMRDEEVELELSIECLPKLREERDA